MTDKTPAAEGPYTKASVIIAACALAGGVGLFMLLWRVLPWLGLVSTSAQRVTQEAFLSQLHGEYHAGQADLRQLSASLSPLTEAEREYRAALITRLPGESLN